MNENQLEAIKDTFTRMAVISGLAFESLTQIFNEFCNAAASVVSLISINNDYTRKLAIEAKKERHRKRYYRMMERREK